MMSKTKKMTTITMLIAISILFHMIESMIPIPVPIPGFSEYRWFDSLVLV